MKIYLAWKQGQQLHKYQWPGEQPLIIGREASCDIVIDDPQMSRRHCRLSVVKEKKRTLLLEDLQSGNGTWVANTCITSQYITYPCSFRVGHSIELDLFIKQRRQPLQRKHVLMAAVFLVIASMGLLFLFWPQTRTAQDFLLAQKQYVLPKLPELPPAQLFVWAKQMSRDAKFNPGALGLAIRAFAAVAKAEADFSLKAEQEQDQLEEELAVRMHKLRFDIHRTVALQQVPQAKRLIGRLRTEAATVSVEMMKDIDIFILEMQQKAGTNL